MIYIHVPFCRSFCTYCDFYSEIAQDNLFEAYTRQVCAEIKRRSKEIIDKIKDLTGCAYCTAYKYLNNTMEDGLITKEGKFFVASV